MLHKDTLIEGLKSTNWNFIRNSTDFNGNKNKFIYFALNSLVKQQFKQKVNINNISTC